VARNGTIGIDNRLPWRLPADLRRFKALTMGHHLVLGRKTYESVGALPGRSIIVVTRQGAAAGASGVQGAASLDAALEIARSNGEDEVFVGGGAEIYRQALERADRLYLTRIDADFAGDTTFPEIDLDRWRVVETRSFAADDRNPYSHTFVILERAQTPAGGDG
jgi:dihydrofolate reductase